jgi:hypothetical protein
LDFENRRYTSAQIDVLILTDSFGRSERLQIANRFTYQCMDWADCTELSTIATCGTHALQEKEK